MNPTSHKGAAPGAPGTGGRTRLASLAATAPHRPATGALDGAMAVAAFGVNEALSGQVACAYALGRLHRAGAEAMSSSQPLLPEGPVRDAAAMAARMQSGIAEAIFETASRWGRAFGGLAFAFPVGPRSALRA